MAIDAATIRGLSSKQHGALLIWIRRIAAIERKFAAYLTSSEWEPHTPMLQYEVYASKWPAQHETYG